MRRKRNPVFLPFVVVTAFLFAGIFISAATEGRGSNKAQREVQETSTRWQLARQDEAEEISADPAGETSPENSSAQQNGTKGQGQKDSGSTPSDSTSGDGTSEVTDSEEPSGFDSLAFTSDPGTNADTEGPAFRLTPDDESGIQYAYVPAEMNGPLMLLLNSEESLAIEAIGASGQSSSENDDKVSEDSSSAGKQDKGSGSAGSDGLYRAGDTLPAFSPGEHYRFSILSGSGDSLGSEEVVFYYTENVPSMYVDTASGSMEAIDKDRHHETSESAVYRIYHADGSPDSSGRCTIKGRGNSTWSQDKRPYNLNLKQENILLGLNSCRKYALIANFWDSTQTRQYYAFKTAERLGLPYTPQTVFVNLYLNGRYQSLYLLTQRLNVKGGTVQITDLDKANKKANPKLGAGLPETVVMDTDDDDHDALAYAWENEPDNLTGGYLLEFQARYEKEDVWFKTDTLHISFKSPETPSVGEYEYISDYVREAEKALYSEDWTNPDTGLSVFDYFDMDSWARMYLIQDFFVQSDDEYYSFFFYKKADSPLLYCGPVWDFDLCLGNMNYGDYYKTSARTLWLKDGRKKWLHRLQQNPAFSEMVADLYLSELEPIVRDLLDKEYEQMVAYLEPDTNLNYLRWHKNLNYQERTGWVRTLLETRVQFLHDYYTDPGSFHRLLFHFAWDDFSYYVKDGETMGFLPTYDYGEKQSTAQRNANGFITGWQDTSSGELLQPETPIYEDREFDPVYIP